MWFFQMKILDTSNKCSRQIFFSSCVKRIFFAFFTLAKRIFFLKWSEKENKIKFNKKWDRMHYKGLHWNIYSSGFLSDRLYQNGSLSRMESKIFIFTGKRSVQNFVLETLIHSFTFVQFVFYYYCQFIKIRRAMKIESITNSPNKRNKHLFPADCDLRLIFFFLLSNWSEEQKNIQFSEKAHQYNSDRSK